MNNDPRRGGATLPELILVLALLGILAGMTVSVTSEARDRVAVSSARDRVAGLVVRAGALARLHRSAVAHITEGAVRIEAPAGTLRDVQPIERQFGVHMTVDGSAEGVRLEFDALGLGRLANRTIRFDRRSSQARLTLSSYGRPRRW